MEYLYQRGCRRTGQGEEGPTGKEEGDRGQMMLVKILLEDLPRRKYKNRERIMI